MTTLTFEQRARDLVQQMTLTEKISQTMHAAPAIERLGIPPYNWWNECLHGVGRAGTATVFPQAIGLAATWNVPLLYEIATVISDEARAKHHEAVRQGVYDIYTGLTMWSPNINIFRDPRWGRGQETYGEDPRLTARLGVAFVRGLQGDDPTYLKVVATAKHFAVHSGPENIRASFDVSPNVRDLWETYLPAFEALVTEGRAASVMGAYNRLYGEPACASPFLLQTILREQWGFTGYVVSDCGAIYNIYAHHKVVATAAEAAALAVNAGCDLECATTYEALGEAIEGGLLDIATLDRALVRVFTARFQLGMFDPPEQVAYAQIPISVNDAPAHRVLARRAAQEAIVLLKNDGLLPLDSTPRRIAVIGPNAHDPAVLLGNYNGTPSASVTPLDGIRARAYGCDVMYARGGSVVRTTSHETAEAVALAQNADLVIYVGGLCQALEGEEGQLEGLTEGMVSQGDRVRIDLPDAQQAVLQALHATGTPVILVLVNGGAVAVPWAHDHLPAIVEAWYGGEEAGSALADILFGDVNPAGRLPVTVYRSSDDLPPFEDYAMQGRTYRYFEGTPLYPFGYGLSYTTFAYDHLHIASGETLEVTVTVHNTGARDGDEVVQVYARAHQPGYPRCWLVAFQRIHLAAHTAQTLTLNVSRDALRRVHEDGTRMLDAGTFTLFAGGGQPDTTPGAERMIHL